jgi:8-oxo-dGTP pyrophosphatase MutT (NUDIX family)
MSSPWKPNVTVAAVIERDGRFLLVEEETPDGVRLNQPAGHLERGETIIAGCTREALEETAHRFTPTALLGVYMSRYKSRRAGTEITYLRFALTGTVGEREEGRRLDRGILGTTWLTAGELRERSVEHRSPLVMQCVDDYLAGRRLPLSALYTDASIIDP